MLSWVGAILETHRYFVIFIWKNDNFSSPFTCSDKAWAEWKWHIPIKNLWLQTGMLEGKRSKGKQREKLIEGLADWLKAGKSLEAIEATKDRKKWRTMIANAVEQGT
ncbi:hypothetical protein PoB_004534700 [Plakobranchus ocellatus]|uniref:Uncharacterized protein n=1 Tax=Plakobranchus ocellatus TaxID=259542 RepID=A0AAV4BIT0_9GAST|nr:hypothetical protein PoB_004534700 [Plakobranchus ocellatus]